MLTPTKQILVSCISAGLIAVAGSWVTVTSRMATADSERKHLKEQQSEHSDAPAHLQSVADLASLKASIEASNQRQDRMDTKLDKIDDKLNRLLSR